MGWVSSSYYRMNLVEADDVLDECTSVLDNPLTLFILSLCWWKRKALRLRVQEARHTFARDAAEQLEREGKLNASGHPGNTAVTAAAFNSTVRDAIQEVAHEQHEVYEARYGI